MLSDTVVGLALLICVGVFATTNLHNILVVRKRQTADESLAEVERPSGVAVGIAALATFLLFLETLAYILLALTGLADPGSIPLSFGFGPLPSMQWIGLALAVIGYSIFVWSVIARGVYGTSWEMKRSHRLVTWGPYRYVRHPSYLAYFLMFISMPLIWHNLLALLPIAGIPGYCFVTAREEELLTQRFGDEYSEYQKRAGRFLPRFYRRRF